MLSPVYGDDVFREAVERDADPVCGPVERLHDQPSHQPWDERSMWVICESCAVLRVSPQSRLAVRVILTLAPPTRCHVAHERQVAGTAPTTGAHAGTGQEPHNKRPRLRVIGLESSTARARMTFGCPLLRAKCKHSTGSQPPQPPAANHVFCISKVLGVCRRVQSHTHSTLSTFSSPLGHPPTDAVLIFAANRTESHSYQTC